MDESKVELLTAHAAPGRIPLGNDTSREQRNWVVRLPDDSLSNQAVDEVAMKLQRAATSAVYEAIAFSRLDPNSPEGQVEVRLTGIDERHCVVSVTTIRLENDVAHAWLVASSAALRALDSVVGVEDLQGIPRRFWKLLLGGPGVDEAEQTRT